MSPSDESPAWRVIADAVAGRSHAKNGGICEDAYCYRTLRGGSLIAAIADGAGTASRARDGALIATSAALEALQTEVDGLESISEGDAQPILLNALKSARGAIELAAGSAERMRDYATTLIVVLARQTFAAAAQIGDGAVVLRDEAGHLHSLTQPRKQAFINETTFLTAADALEAASTTVWRGSLDGIAAFTDGLQMLALNMPAHAPHSPFFGPLFEFARQPMDVGEAADELRAFLLSPKVADRSDDDLTLLLAVLEIRAP